MTPSCPQPLTLTWGLIQHAPKRCSEHLFKGVIHHLSGI
ncbi:MAG: hypothetical protein AVDCRST_MAG93-5594 [uncultured Chloroflexia bacterium]|uniref:Uncharacterized protein n=1 Tax=uncultured Chloroflexia bacterium TaxID=1672391 RepID=A0A6J4L2S3_9CHLR|nr:MAG: hypothetical protein AVDCRST_MAG93-5594 [uncultured Chloroflexia bacterium]